MSKTRRPRDRDERDYNDGAQQRKNDNHQQHLREKHIERALKLKDPSLLLQLEEDAE